MPIQSSSRKPDQLPWHNSAIHWEDFQMISLYLYRDVYQDKHVDEFLKSGASQYGIDLKSFKHANGRFACVQCKHHQKLSLSGLKKILQLFESNRYYDVSDVFIITTSADFQHTKVQQFLDQKKQYYRDKKNLEFDCWDVHRLETLLARRYDIVEKYFGVELAKAHCFVPGIRQQAYEQVPGFIQRSLRDMNAPAEEFPWGFHKNDSPPIRLRELLLANDDTPKRIGVIAEAYEGKSTLFKQIAFELSSINSVALLVDLKKANASHIEEILTIQFSTWESVPAKELVLLIDGLDEIAADQILTTTRYIGDSAQTDHLIPI